MKLIAKIIVWMLAAPIIVILLVLGFPLGILFIQIQTDWLDGVPNEIINIASYGGEIAWLFFVILPFVFNHLLAGGS